VLDLKFPLIIDNTTGMLYLKIIKYKDIGK